MSAVVAELPRITPDFRSKTITNTSVSVANGGDIDAAISTMMATNKRRILLAEGGSFTWNSTNIPVHGFSDWCEITTDGALPGISSNTRMTRDLMTTTYNLPTITVAMGTNIKFAPGARRWRLRGLHIVSAATAGYNSGLGDTRAIVQTAPDNADITSVADIPSHIHVSQCVIGGAEETNHGTSNRKDGLNTNGSMIHVGDCTIYNINYGGVTYAVQSQSSVCFGGFGKILIENCFLWGSTETVAFGGAAQNDVLAVEQVTPSDVTIRKCHLYRPLSVQGFQGCANGIEFKFGRRILLEANIVENVYAELQNGMALALWSVNQSDTQPWTHFSDVTVQYNWFKNTSAIFSLNPNDEGEVGPSIDGLRATFRHNIVTGHGISPIPVFRSIAIESLASGSSFADVLVERNLIINHATGYWWVASPYAIKRATIQDNIIGGYYILFTSSGYGQTAWDILNADASCDFRRNLAVDFAGGTTPNTGTNTVLASIAAIGFVDAALLSSTATRYADLAGLALDVSSPYKGTGPGGTDPGPDMDAVIAALAGVESTDAEYALYEDAVASDPIGINFRKTLAYVTDDAGYAACLGEVYPFTRNGLTFGWNLDISAAGTNDLLNTNIPQLAGENHGQVAAAIRTFTLDLPEGPGTYLIGAAFGDASVSRGPIEARVKDGATVLFTLTGVSTSAANKFLDATGVERDASAWLAGQAFQTVTIAGSTLTVDINLDDGNTGGFVMIACLTAQKIG